MDAKRTTAVGGELICNLSHDRRKRDAGRERYFLFSPHVEERRRRRLRDPVVAKPKEHRADVDRQNDQLQNPEPVDFGCSPVCGIPPPWSRY